MKQSIFTIVSNEALTDMVYKMILEGDTSAITNCGQFVDLRLPEKYRAVLADPLIAALRLNGAAHAGAETAAHPLLEGVLAGSGHHLLHSLEHGHGAAGIEVSIVKVSDHIGDKALGANASVSSSDVHFCTQSLEFLRKEDFRTGVKAQHHLRVFSFCNQLFAQVKHGRHTHTTTYQNGAVTGERSVVSIAQAGQHIQFGANGKS